ncbi:prostamide/prostaglandin F synthase-like [Oryza brachyantha]|nr:prostamide/prostaglandin F synthase-like [Oryza brachyantha]
METAASLSRAPLAGAGAGAARVAVAPAAVPALASRGSLCRRRRRSLTVSAAEGASPPVSPSPTPDASSPGVWDALGGVSVLAAGTGDAVPLTELWDPTEGVAVVALLRHFGCFCCWELASVLKDSMAKFEEGGAKLIAIGVGTPDKARILADRLPFPIDNLYADPDRKAYDVLGMYHGVGRTLFSPASAKIYSRLDYIKKATKNYTLEGTPANLTGVLQQGGMLVFRGKQLLYSWKDEGTGDHAPLDDVLNVCCKAPAA